MSLRRYRERAVERPSQLAAILPLGILVLAALVTFYARLRLIALPLERDEGEYAYLAQLLLQGRPPFLDAYTMKLPGMPIAYAAFMSVFGQRTEAVHLGLLAVNATTACFLWLIARRLFDYEVAAASTAFFLLLTISKSVIGVFAHATHFVNLFALAGLWLLLNYQERRRKRDALVAGLCFGIAILMKQHAVVLAIFALCLVAWIARKHTTQWIPTISTCALFATGATIPLAFTVLWTIDARTFGTLWFWTVEYALEYAREVPFSAGLPLLELQLTRIASQQLPVWILAALGVIVLFLARDLERRTSRMLVIGLLISSFVAVCPGFYFREHYFVLILPAVAMLAGLAVTKGAALASPKWPATGNAVSIIFLVGALCYGYWTERAYLFERPATGLISDLYRPNPFQESVAIARYINMNSAPSDTIAVLGSEPELYFYANRRAATGHIYMYGLMEAQPYAETMQQQAIAEIEASRPLYLVYVNVPYSWVVNEKSPTGIFHWFREYADRNYRLTGVVDIGRRDSRYVWGEEATSYLPQSENFVTVWRRSRRS